MRIVRPGQEVRLPAGDEPLDARHSHGIFTSLGRSGFVVDSSARTAAALYPVLNLRCSRSASRGPPVPSRADRRAERVRIPRRRPLGLCLPGQELVISRVDRRRERCARQQPRPEVVDAGRRGQAEQCGDVEPAGRAVAREPARVRCLPQDQTRRAITHGGLRSPRRRRPSTPSTALA